MYCNCMNNQQVCVHVCQHILLFPVPTLFVPCAFFFLQCYFLDNCLGGVGCANEQNIVGPHFSFSNEMKVLQCGLHKMTEF